MAGNGKTEAAALGSSSRERPCPRRDESAGGAHRIRQAAYDRAPRSTEPEPGAKITRDIVLATALELIDRDGVSRLSMRRLAAELACDPMTRYRYAPSKAALLDGV
ncbi:MAG: TetR/AcrR family transcriptional regulator, partial [Acidimicrobiales bacterium]